MESKLLTIRTGTQQAVVNLAEQAASFVAGRTDGLLHVFVPMPQPG